MYPFITLFGKEIPFYGILYFIGIFASSCVAVPLCKKRDIQRYDLAYASVYAMITGTVGAKSLFLIVSAKQIVEQQLGFDAVLKGGFVFYGGLIGGAIGLFIYTRQFHLPSADFFDLFAAVLPLGHAIGRIGCFISGCCYGMPYDGFLAYTYRYSLGGAPVDTPLLPIQLIEASCLLLLFVILLTRYLRRPQMRGTVASVYLVAYPTVRFVLEFFRGDSVRGAFLGLSTSQWISLALLFTAVFYSLILRRKRKN